MAVDFCEFNKASRSSQLLILRRLCVELSLVFLGSRHISSSLTCKLRLLCTMHEPDAISSYCSPDKNKFLTPEQTDFVQDRVNRDRGDAQYDPLTWKKAIIYAKDLKVWAFGFIFMFAITSIYVRISRSTSVVKAN